MRILHVVGDSKFGGASRMVIALAADAIRQGFVAEVLTTDSPFQAALAASGIPVVDLDVARRALNPWVDLRGVVRLSRFLRKNRYNVVHTHTSKGGFIGRIAATVASVPAVIHTAHGFAIHEASPARHVIPYAILEGIAGLCCDRIVCVSEFHRDWGIELGIGDPDKTIAIVNGIPPSRVRATVPAQIVRADLGIAANQLMVITPGRLFAQKGLETLLESIAKIAPEQSARARFVLVGDGPLRGSLEQLAARLGITDAVLFPGFREDVADLLAAADLVVLPSIREGLSVALLESIAAGKPIIATSIGSNREVGAKRGALLLVPPEDAAALHDAITRALENPGLRARLSGLASSTYQAYYTEEQMLRTYSDLYKTMLGTRESLASPAEAV